MTATDHVGMRLKDRPEFASKKSPLTRTAEVKVSEAVAEMVARGYGSVIVVDGDDKVVGIVTERDLMRKLINENRDPTTTSLGDIMTTELRLAREDDEVLNWLRIMSNERFRRLPVVDSEGRIKAVFSQGDFVSYTWPDLIYQAKQMARASIGQNYGLWMIGGGIMLYTILMVVLVSNI
ncbi:cyclic nucleotide-binding/CBS domain-containing protein [Limimaricola pyoseonensis]|uniref:CBS domain-containing protein n=1 Tax=Limimaricola pyoseonensis TaxID=521013 RepID=A0A1G7EEB0_9RHOB|nr:CBS domain-containing protein [Limimaricola pyoseonensis]SDE61715.1 CBS domain-containing protein [Limimaricola pyoseonensis]